MTDITKRIPPKRDMDRALKAGQIIDQLETGTESDSGPPWQNRECPLGVLYFGRNKAGKVRLMLEHPDGACETVKGLPIKDRALITEYLEGYDSSGS